MVGQKASFKVKDIWALRVRLQMQGLVRELALFNLGIDSKLRGYDLVALKVRDVCHGDQLATRSIVMQNKTKRPAQFEITAATREALQTWIRQAALKSDDFLFPSRLHESPHLGTRRYARVLGHWVEEPGLDRAEYGTHSMRRTKATLIYRRTTEVGSSGYLYTSALAFNHDYFDLVRNSAFGSVPQVRKQGFARRLIVS